MPTRIFVNESSKERSLWYDDGTIVIQAADTVFRVYGGLLAAKSTVFRNMLSFPKPPVLPVNVYEGCDVVHVPDSASDMYYFLLAIHEFECVYIQSIIQRSI
jgi:hypothetical protein